ncbi:uncharacterized protein LOC119673221 [Teleopsis dalmanni]|uniref:uncharacterized protein LOC119673221 n=1 Tax=Teleopsis dalmanni TaxID=139649 RepID=UPI0018CF9AD1|nr:uncharacterized protein LOC119673221 [Teleopsis dalmanni]
MSKRRYKRGRCHLSLNEEKTFIKCWAENGHHLRKQRRNNHVVLAMCAQLASIGVKISATEARNKMHNLVHKYRIEEGNMTRSGSHSVWPHYHDMHKLLNITENNEKLNEECTERTKLESKGCSSLEWADCYDDNRHLIRTEGSGEEFIEMPIKAKKYSTEKNIKSPLNSVSECEISNDSHQIRTPSERYEKVDIDFQYCLLDKLGGIQNEIAKMNKLMEVNDAKLLKIEKKKLKQLKKYVQDSAEFKQAFIAEFKKKS